MIERSPLRWEVKPSKSTSLYLLLSRRGSVTTVQTSSTGYVKVYVTTKIL